MNVDLMSIAWTYREKIR